MEERDYVTTPLGFLWRCLLIFNESKVDMMIVDNESKD
jgi:hypothetical protein